MTEPTDAELLEVIREAARGGAVRRDGSTSLRIARAVLARWGQPSGAGEPYGYVYAVQVAPVVGDERKVVRTVFTQKKPPCDSLPLYTTPQPTQTVLPAGREPLPFTPRQRERLFNNRPANVGKGLALADWHRVVEFIEAAHGIKGGQHGAE